MIINLSKKERENFKETGCVPLERVCLNMGRTRKSVTIHRKILGKPSTTFYLDGDMQLPSGNLNIKLGSMEAQKRLIATIREAKRIGYKTMQLLLTHANTCLWKCNFLDFQPELIDDLTKVPEEYNARCDFQYAHVSFIPYNSNTYMLLTTGKGKSYLLHKCPLDLLTPAELEGVLRNYLQVPHITDNLYQTLYVVTEYSDQAVSLSFVDGYVILGYCNKKTANINAFLNATISQHILKFAKPV